MTLLRCRQNRGLAILGLLAACLFSATPASVLAHLLAHHTGSAPAATVDVDDQGTAPAAHAVCKLCVAHMAAGAAAASHLYVPSFAESAQHDDTPHAIVAFTCPAVAAYQSRAPPPQ